VPPASLTALAVLDVHPNPSRGEIRVSFSLAPGGPATLALIDVAGRRVCERTVNGSATSGRRTVDLTAGARPAAGVYLVRLTQDGRSVVRRVSILR
jgi:hypothetical protein